MTKERKPEDFWKSPPDDEGMPWPVEDDSEKPDSGYWLNSAVYIGSGPERPVRPVKKEDDDA